jgi:hypothetical protein
MTANRRINRQLELPMLVDVNTKNGSTSKVCDAPVQATQDTVQRPSEQDMTVYRQISSNYFHSLKKR